MSIGAVSAIAFGIMFGAYAIAFIWPAIQALRETLRRYR